MRRCVALIILGLTVAAALPATAAPATSDWPGLNADVSQSNDNPAERGITRSNALELRVRWSVLMAPQSYAVVASNRVYVPVVSKRGVTVNLLNASNGRPLSTIARDASGGMLVANNLLWLAGRMLQAVDLATGARVARIKVTPASPGAVFLNPETDGKYVLAGYAAGDRGRIVVVDPGSGTVVRAMPSTSATGALVGGRVATRVTAGSVLYNELTGAAVARPAYVGSNWFAAGSAGFTVATGSSGRTSLFAFDATGRYLWSHLVGPALTTRGADWPHAVTANAVYVQMLAPRQGVVALDPLSGRVLWQRSLANVQYLVAANGLLFVLTYALGLPVRLVVLQATTGKPVGQQTFSDGFYAFPAQNEMMIAGGMLFLRLIGPGGPALVALGL